MEDTVEDKEEVYLENNVLYVNIFERKKFLSKIKAFNEGGRE